MDSKHRSELETARQRTLRYLFRGWGPRSGGDAALNNPKRITPRAFLLGRGHKHVYDLTYEEFDRITRDHLQSLRDPGFATEFSSWSHDLNVAVRHAKRNGPDAYVSIMDTQELWQTNPAFHVPLLPVRHRHYPHEFLVHGVIEGDSLRAVPAEWFFSFPLRDPYEISSFGMSVKSPGYSIQRMRSVGERYGVNFAMAVTLALVGAVTEIGVSTAAFWEAEKISSILEGMVVPESWLEDRSIMADVVMTTNHHNAKQFIRLMRYCAKIQRNGRLQLASEGVEARPLIIAGAAPDHEAPTVPREEVLRPVGSERKLKYGTPARSRPTYTYYIERRVKDVRSDASYTEANKGPNTSTDIADRISRRKWTGPRPVRRHARTKTGARSKPRISKREAKQHQTRAATKQVKIKKLWPLRKQLAIDMNRHGRNANGGENEESIVAMLDGMQI